MPVSTKSHARVRWIPSFVAFCNTANLTRAAAELDVTPNTIKSHVLELERWTSRYLIDEGEDGPEPTKQAYEYLPDLAHALHMIVAGGLTSTIERATISSEGFYYVSGKRLQSEAGAEVVNMLFRVKASLSTGTRFSPHPRVDGSKIAMD